MLRMLQGSGPILPTPSSIGGLGLLALNQSLTSDKAKNNIALGTARAKGLNNPFIPEDPVLSPDSIQKDLNRTKTYKFTNKNTLFYKA